MNKEPVQQLLVRLPESKHHALKLKCVEDKVPIVTVIQHLIDLYLAGEVKVPPRPKSARE